MDLKLQNEVDLSILKNEPVVVFTTHQTDSMFILTFDLKKGFYGRKDIKIDINEDGSRITISGENPNISFHKTFIIPDGVVLDKVKARFDQQQSRLTIKMPKLVKGLIDGIRIQEFKDPHIPIPSPVPVPDQQNHHLDEEIQGESKQEPKEVKSESQVDDNEGPKNVAEKTYTTPMIAAAVAGSTLFVSLIVALFSFIRSKNESSKKKN